MTIPGRSTERRNVVLARCSWTHSSENWIQLRGWVKKIILSHFSSKHKNKTHLKYSLEESSQLIKRTSLIIYLRGIKCLGVKISLNTSFTRLNNLENQFISCCASCGTLVHANLPVIGCRFGPQFHIKPLVLAVLVAQEQRVGAGA